MLRPSQHERHSHGPVGVRRGDNRAPPGRPHLPQHAVRVGHDHRSQEDRCHVPDQLVHLLLHRWATGAGRAFGARPARTPVRDRSGLQRAVHDARHVHDLPVHHPDPGGLRELHRAAPYRRTGRGVPAHQRAVALAAADGRPAPAAELLHRPGAGRRVDELQPARPGPAARKRRSRSGPVDRRRRPRRHELDPRARSTSS